MSPIRRWPAQMPRLLVLSLVLSLILPLLGACDLFGPSGPGTLTVFLDGGDRALGAAALEVAGPGIQGFEGAGSVRLFSRETSQSGVHRVVLLNPDGAGLLFRVHVSDLDGPGPSVVVVSAADTSNALLESDAPVAVGVLR